MKPIKKYSTKKEPKIKKTNRKNQKQWKNIKSVETISPRRDVIRPSRLFSHILLLEAFISNKIVTIKIVALFWCLYCKVVWVFKHDNTNLRSIPKGLGIIAEDWSSKQSNEHQ